MRKITEGEGIMTYTQKNNNASAHTVEDCFSTKQSALFSLATVLFALALPISATQTPITDFIAWLICFAFGALVLITSRRFSSIIILSFILFFFASYAGSAASVALIVGTVAACGVYSALASQARSCNIALLAIIPAVVFSCAYALTQEIVLAVAAIAIFLPSLAMGISLRRGGNRVQSIACFSTAAITETVIAALLIIYLENGYLSFELVGRIADNFRLITIEMFTAAIEAAGETAVSADIALMIDEMAIEMTNLLVGLTCAAIITVGYFAQKIQHSLFERFELESFQNESGAPIKASAAAAIVYVVAYICSFTTGASSAPSFTAVAAGNISLILLPLLLYVGFGFLINLPKKIGALALVVWAATFIAAYLLSSSVIDILALVGAFNTLLVNIDVWAEEHYSKGEDQ